MKPDDLPKPLADWLLELEGFHIRLERLYEERKTDMARNPARVLDWLLVAYEGGVEEEQKRAKLAARTAKHKS